MGGEPSFFLPRDSARPRRGRAQRLQPVEAVVPGPCRDPGPLTVPEQKLRPREGLMCPGHTVSSTDPSHLTHTLVPLPCHDSFPSLGRLLPSAADSSLGRESKVCWSRRSWSASQTQPLTAKGCHSFSVHLICLKTMKKNLSRLFASAAAVIYGAHQSPLPQLVPSFSPKLPKAGVGGDEAIPSQPVLSATIQETKSPPCLCEGKAVYTVLIIAV